MKKIVTLFGTLLLALCLCCGLAACGEGGKDAVETESVTLDKTALTLEVGGEATLTATVTPENATEKTVTWVSNKPEIAKVENGKVTALAEGAATITASAGGKSATCAVTVTAAASAGEVSAEEWKAIFDGTKNFTFNVSSQPNFHVTVKIDGDKQEQDSDYGKGIIAKENGKYFDYNYNNGSWTRSELSESDYTQSMQVNGYNTLRILQDYFTQFTCEGEGVYTCAVLDLSEQIAVSQPQVIKSEMRGISVTIKDGALVALSFSLFTDQGEGGSGTSQLVFSEFGTTAIELPTEFAVL